jgi:hypothetical protein
MDTKGVLMQFIDRFPKSVWESDLCNDGLERALWQLGL